MCTQFVYSIAVKHVARSGHRGTYVHDFKACSREERDVQALSFLSDVECSHTTVNVARVVASSSLLPRGGNPVVSSFLGHIRTTRKHSTLILRSKLSQFKVVYGICESSCGQCQKSAGLGRCHIETIWFWKFSCPRSSQFCKCWFALVNATQNRLFDIIRLHHSGIPGSRVQQSILNRAVSAKVP